MFFISVIFNFQEVCVLTPEVLFCFPEFFFPLLLILVLLSHNVLFFFSKIADDS